MIQIDESSERPDQLTQTGWIKRLLTSHRFLDIAPVAVIALYGALWIALHASENRGFTHAIFQSLALIENTVALLFRRLKPMGALLSIVAVFAIVNLEATTLLPVLLALLTVAILSKPRTIVVAVTATILAVAWHAKDYLPGDPVRFIGYAVEHAVVMTFVVATGVFIPSGTQLKSLFQPSTS
jgi:hypothetical protein